MTYPVIADRIPSTDTDTLSSTPTVEGSTLAINTSDTKNNADSLIYQAQKQLQDLDGRVSEADKSRAEALMVELRSAIDRENYDRMRSLTTDLQQALMQIGSAVYAQANAGTRNPNPTTQPIEQSNDDVIDADFVG